MRLRTVLAAALIVVVAIVGIRGCLSKQRTRSDAHQELVWNDVAQVIDAELGYRGVSDARQIVQVLSPGNISAVGQRAMGEGLLWQFRPMGATRADQAVGLVLKGSDRPDRGTAKVKCAELTLIADQAQSRLRQIPCPEGLADEGNVMGQGRMPVHQTTTALISGPTNQVRGGDPAIFSTMPSSAPSATDPCDPQLLRWTVEGFTQQGGFHRAVLRVHHLGSKPCRFVDNPLTLWRANKPTALTWRKAATASPIVLSAQTSAQARLRWRPTAGAGTPSDMLVNDDGSIFEHWVSITGGSGLDIAAGSAIDQSAWVAPAPGPAADDPSQTLPVVAGTCQLALTAKDESTSGERVLRLTLTNAGIAPCRLDRALQVLVRPDSSVSVTAKSIRILKPGTSASLRLTGSDWKPLPTPSAAPSGFHPRNTEGPGITVIAGSSGQLRPYTGALPDLSTAVLTEA